VDTYVIYDEESGDPNEEVWSCRTLAELYDRMARRGLRLADFEEVV
jgi:hypothetical protein